MIDDINMAALFLPLLIAFCIAVTGLIKPSELTPRSKFILYLKSQTWPNDEFVNEIPVLATIPLDINELVVGFFAAASAIAGGITGAFGSAG